MMPLVLLALIPANIVVLDSKDFPKEAQVRAVTATVRVLNITQGDEGRGVILKLSRPLFYVLTDNHAVDGGSGWRYYDLHCQHHPKGAAIYRTAEGALTLFGGSVRALLSDPAAAAEFRVDEPVPVVKTAAVKADPADDPLELELTGCEQTKLNVSGHK